MTNHTNSPKIRKALEGYRAAKAEFDVKQAALADFDESHPVRGLSWEDGGRRDLLQSNVMEALSAINLAESAVSRLIWAYYKGKLSNREIMDIVTTTLL